MRPPNSAIRLLAAPTLLLALTACAVEDELIIRSADLATAAPLDRGLDLLAGGASEWLFFTPADGATMADAVTFDDGTVTIDGDPKGYLATRRWYRDYVLEFDWRWADGREGNSGLLVHATTPLTWHDWPRCVEIQLRSGDAGDFILMADHVGLWANDEDEPRAGSTPQAPDIDRRVVKTVDGLEQPIGGWNTMRVECADDAITVWVNGTLVNEARGCTVSEGAIAFQSEGTPIAFRNIRLAPAPR